MLFTWSRPRNNPPLTYRVFSLPYLFLLLASCLLANQPAYFSDVIAKTKQAERNGSYTEAEQLLQTALPLFREPGSPFPIALWNELGYVHRQQRRFDDAEHDYLTALDLNTRLINTIIGEQITSLNNLGVLALEAGHLVQAQERFQQAKAITEHNGSVEPATSILILSNLGMISQKQKKYDAARNFYREAEEIVFRTRGEHSIEYAKLLSCEGLLSYQIGDDTDALAKDKLALVTVNQLGEVNTRDRANLENNLAVVLLRLGNVLEAERRLTQAVALYRSAGIDLQLAQALNSLAIAQAKMDNFEAARRNAEEAFHLALQLVGADSEQAARAHNTLGCIELRQRKWAAAKADFARALEIWANAKGIESAEYAAALTNLGTLDNDTGNHKGAEACYRRALAIDQVQLGADHPQVAVDLSNVAAQVFGRKQWDEAIELYQHAREIQEKRFGPDSVQVAKTWRNIASAEERSKRFDDADHAFSNAVRAFKASPDSDQQNFSLCLREYAALLRTMQRFNEAEGADLLATRIQVVNAIRAEKLGTPESGTLSFR